MSGKFSMTCQCKALHAGRSLNVAVLWTSARDSLGAVCVSGLQRSPAGKGRRSVEPANSSTESFSLTCLHKENAYFGFMCLEEKYFVLNLFFFFSPSLKQNCEFLPLDE